MDMGKIYVYSHRRSWPRSPTYDGENLRAFLFVCYKCRYSAELPFRSTLFRPGEAAVAQWLRCCATNRKVAGLIPYGVIGIFYWHNASDRTMALGSTEPLTEMSTRSIFWG